MTVKLIETGQPNIVIVELTPPYRGYDDGRDGARAVLAHYQWTGQRVVAIWDFSAANLTFSTMMAGMSAVTELPEVYIQNVESVAVGTDKLVELIADAAGQEQYQGLNVPFYTLRDDAMTYALGVCSAWDDTGLGATTA